MKKIFLPTLFFLFSFCEAQNTPQQLDSLVKAGVDPYFVDSKDTVSPNGPDCITRDLLQDKKGNFWFASWHGIIKYDGKVFTNYTLKEGLIRFHIRSLFEDSKGNIWFGTARGGLYKYNPSAELRKGGKTFTLYTTKQGLADNTVTCIAEDSDGGMWFGTEGGGISRYDGKKFTTVSKIDGISGNNVNAIMQDRNGIVWIGTMEGTCCYNIGVDGTPDRNNLFFPFTDEKGQPVKKALSIIEDKKGYVWIGTYDGLVRTDSAISKTVLRYAKKFDTELSPLLTYYFAEDKSGNIWFTQSKKNAYYSDLPCQVLYKYDGKKFSKVLEKYEPVDFQIFGKAFDKDGNLWFGTMHGPCMFNPESANKGKPFKYFTE